MMFHNESQVRKWVRHATGGRARWIEPSLGSTLGLPDAVYVLGGDHFWLECKVGEYDGRLLTFKVTKEQKRELLRLKNDGAMVAFLIGVQDALLGVDVNPMSIQGKVNLDAYFNDRERAILFSPKAENGINVLVRWMREKRAEQVRLLKMEPN